MALILSHSGIFWSIWEWPKFSLTFFLFPLFALLYWFYSIVSFMFFLTFLGIFLHLVDKHLNIFLDFIYCYSLYVVVVSHIHFYIALLGFASHCFPYLLFLFPSYLFFLWQCFLNLSALFTAGVTYSFTDCLISYCLIILCFLFMSYPFVHCRCDK